MNTMRLLALAFALVLPLRAAPGDLDPTFGSGGRVTTQVGPFTSQGCAVAVQPDGRILVAGLARLVAVNGNNDFAIARYNADGSLDTTFGGDGMVTTDIAGEDDRGFAIAIQQDGRILVGGDSDNGTNRDFAIVRYNSDGSLDTSFNLTGFVVTPIGTQEDYGAAILIQNDGKIVLGGTAGGSGPNGSDFAIARYNPDGSLDTAFGGSGIVTATIDLGDTGSALALLADGRIVLAGNTNGGFAMLQFLQNGSLDTTFSGDGKATVAVAGATDHAFAVAIQSDGKIVAAGDALVAGNYDFAILRLNSDGTLDSSFNGGSVTLNVSSGDDYIRGVAIQPNGRIIVGGGASAASGSDFALARYNANGTLDGSFGTGGVVKTSFGSADEGAFAIALQSDGRIVEAGYTWSFGPQDFAVARLIGDDVTTVPPVLTAPADNTRTTAPITVTFTLPEAALPGSVKLQWGATTLTLAAAQEVAGTRTFTLDPANPGASPAVASVFNGPITDAEYAVTLQYQDALGNPLASDTNTGVTVDTVTLAPTLLSPVANTEPAIPILVRHGLPELVQPGSVKLAFGPHVLTLVDYAFNDGFTFHPANPVGTSGGHIVSGGPIPDGTYAVVVSYQDDLGNAVASATSVNVTVNAVLENTLLYARGEVLPTAGVDPYIPAGAVWHGFGVPAVDQAGRVAFQAKWKNPSAGGGGYGGGVFIDGHLRVYVGQAVPGVAGATFKKFRDPLVSNDHLAVLATIEGAGVVNTNDAVLIRVRPDASLTLIAREGDATIADGAALKAFKSVDISGGDVSTGPTGILYTATLTQGSGTPAATKDNDYLAALFRNGTTSTVAREGGAYGGFAVGETVKSFTLLKALSGSPGQARGHYYPDIVNFFAKLSSGRQALLEHFEGATNAARFTGSTVGGGAFPTATWKGLGVLADSASAFAMKAAITGGTLTAPSATGLFRTSGTPNDPWAELALLGDAAGPGLTFSAFKDPVLQGSGGEQLAFGATVLDGSAVKTAALYWTPGDVVTALAQAGAPAPGGGTFAKFTSLAYPGGGTGPLFLASLTLGVDGIDKSNDVGLWTTDSSGTLHQALREGDTVGGKTIKTLTVLKTVSGTPGTTHAFNAAGAIVSKAAFTDGSSGIVKTSVP